MNREHEPQHEPYWQMDIAIREGIIDGERSTIRLQTHVAVESYTQHQELVPLRAQVGQRVYVHARPYILESMMTLTVSASTRPVADGSIGTVESAAWEGLRHRDIGNAQGWCYPAEHLVVLWECYLFESVREEDPLEDETLATLWRGFEETLLDQSPGAQRIVTPSWEEIYNRTQWQAFLTAQGYRPVNARAFVKELL